MALTAIIGGQDLFAALDRSPAARKGLVLVRCSDQLSEILSYCQKLAPCTVLLDADVLTTPSKDLESFKHVLGSGLLVKALVRVDNDDPGFLEPLLRMGCSGFLKPGASPAMIRRAVCAVEAGEIWTSRRLLSRMLRNGLVSERLNLTPREREVLELIGNGHKNHEIAAHLFISTETVRWHIRSLYGKIGVRDRLSAALFARNILLCGDGQREQTQRQVRTV